MNPALEDLGKRLLALAGRFIPLGYTLGRQKAQRRYGVDLPWTDADNVAVNTLMEQNADALAEWLARQDAALTAGADLGDVLEGMAAHAGSWAWVLSPALAMGLSRYVEEARPEIARQETEGGLAVSADEIGVIWWNSRDDRVCPICRDLTGRWFAAKEAYELASSLHFGCRCSAHFDVGTPDEAVVGPRAPFRTGTVAQWMRQYGVFD